MSEPYVNHVALSLDGSHSGFIGGSMRWEPGPPTEEDS